MSECILIKRLKLKPTFEQLYIGRISNHNFSAMVVDNMEQAHNFGRKRSPQTDQGVRDLGNSMMGAGAAVLAVTAAIVLFARVIFLSCFAPRARLTFSDRNCIDLVRHYLHWYRSGTFWLQEYERRKISELIC